MKNTLLAFSLFSGIAGLFVMFAVSFLIVHILLLAKAGWDSKKPKTEKPPVQTEEPKKTPAPVYYLVEKRKKRPKNNYSEPREIHFK
jgi:hypothetical protein